MTAFFFAFNYEDCHYVKQIYLYHGLRVNADCQEIVTVKSVCKGIYGIRRIVTI